MAGLTRRLAIAALACAGVLAAAPASAEWTEWAPADELGWVSGDADAPLTVIEYFSPTCSHCRDFAETVMPRVEADYIATGKVRFVLREFIRNKVDQVIISQARCLDKEKGLAFLHDVFARQDDIFVAAQIGTLPGTLIGLSTPYGIADRERFDACYTDMNIRFDIVSVDESAAHYDVHSTPTFVVGGEVREVTARMATPEGFAEFLDAELARAAGASH